jgi:uncharacterized RDD family membrane protein YckC
MKCEKCGNEYPSQYYFTTPTICTECFKKMPAEEQQFEYSKASRYMGADEYPFRIGFGRRLGAALLDMLFVSIFMMILVMLTVYNDIRVLVPEILTNPGAMNEIVQRIVPLSLICSVIYYSLEIFIAATPGKLLLRIQIAKDDRTRASMNSLFIRFIVKHIDYFFTLLVLLTSIEALNFLSSTASLAILVGFFFVLAGKKQAFHDMLSKTAVYYKDDVLDQTMNQSI